MTDSDIPPGVNEYAAMSGSMTGIGESGGQNVAHHPMSYYSFYDVPKSPPFNWKKFAINWIIFPVIIGLGAITITIFNPIFALQIIYAIPYIIGVLFLLTLISLFLTKEEQT